MRAGGNAAAGLQGAPMTRKPPDCEVARPPGQARQGQIVPASAIRPAAARYAVPVASVRALATTPADAHAPLIAPLQVSTRARLYCSTTPQNLTLPNSAEPPRRRFSPTRFISRKGDSLHPRLAASRLINAIR